jgi:cytoskeletal protein CcmA (bactofilin family)
MIGVKDQKGVPRGEEVNAFLGKGTTFEGKMTFEGLFRLDGKFNGEIFSGDSLIIGETGEVHAEITVNILIVKGKLEGSITAKTRVEIHPPGKILGDIQTPVLVIEEGAIFDGNCRMEKAESKREEKISVLKMKGETEGAKGTTEMEKESGS